MIGRLRGDVIDRLENVITVDVQGVGYLVTVSAQNDVQVGQTVDLHIHTHVREDALHLFGFTRQLERDVFNLLISVPNVGPTKAIGILASSAEQIIEIARAGEAVRLAKLPGLGKKTAERILVDVGEKLVKLSGATGTVRGAEPFAAVDHAKGKDLVSALLNLGYRPQTAEAASSKALGQLGEDAPLENLVKEALVNIARV